MRMSRFKVTSVALEAALVISPNKLKNIYASDTLLK
jgi:hypothetical protein